MLADCLRLGCGPGAETPGCEGRRGDGGQGVPLLKANPCVIKGASVEKSPERAIATTLRELMDRTGHSSTRAARSTSTRVRSGASTDNGADL
jgi:hypothetical protein